eukprot:scaffold242621_cov30-Tisochrysis_lutea.AAC.6
MREIPSASGRYGCQPWRNGVVTLMQRGLSRHCSAVYRRHYIDMLSDFCISERTFRNRALTILLRPILNSLTRAIVLPYPLKAHRRGESMPRVLFECFVHPRGNNSRLFFELLLTCNGCY